MDLMKPPNSAPRTSSGTSPPRRVSMAMPYSPIRLAAIAPSTRSRRAASTSLNTAHLFSRDLGQPVLQLDDRLALVERGQLLGHSGILGIAREDVLVDVARIVGQALPGIEVGHGDRAGHITRDTDRGRLTRGKNVRFIGRKRGRLLFLIDRRGHFGR